MEKHDNIPEETRDEKLESFAKRNESKKKLLKYLSIPAVIIAIIVFAVVCFVFFFKVRTIEVKGASKYNAQTLVIASKIEMEDLNPPFSFLEFISQVDVKTEFI